MSAVVRRSLAVSGLCLLLQVAMVTYPDADQGAAVLWLLVGAVLLVLVGRHSAVVRALVVVTSWVGAVVCVVGVVEDPANLVLVVLFLGQALPLQTRAVRQHVRRSPRAVVA